MSSSMDCLVVGYNDTTFSDLLQRHEPFRDVSGGYRHLMVNSVPFRGQRLKYFDLFNHTRAMASAGDSLHVARMPNLAVCYLVSYLRRRGLTTEFINFFNVEQDQFRALLAESPAVVAITTTFYFEPEPVREIVNVVREYSPQTKVVVGGPYIYNVCNDHPVKIQNALFDRMGADLFVFDSQGEEALARICTALRDTTADLSRIPNLIVREKAGVYQRADRVAEHNDIENDAVDWTSFDPSFLTPTVQTRTARSCAYKCAFCRYPGMAGALEVMPLERVERDLDYLHRIGTKQVLFIDDTFNVPVKRFKEICRLMIRKQYDFRWYSYFRCANADMECFDLMAGAGCTGVFLGIESGDDGVLKQMNKVATTAKYEVGIRELNARGIITFASFIVGYPSETEESARNTVEFIRATQPTFYCLETFFYDPKTPVGSLAAQFGLTGTAYAWKHNTMDWRRASEIVENAYRTMSGSIVLPLYGFDLWSIAYLAGHGITRQQVTEFLRVASRLMVSDPATSSTTTADEDRLVAMWQPAAS